MRQQRPHLVEAPGPRGLPLLGVALAFRKDPLALLVDSLHDYGDVVCLPIGPQRFHFVHHPDLVRQVLQEDRATFSKAGGLNEILRSVLGDGMLNCVPEDLWLRNRQLMQPAFRRDALARYADGMVATTRRVLARWQHIGPDQPISMTSEMSKLTLRIVLEALFTHDLDDEDVEVVSQAVTCIQEHIKRRLMNPLSLPERVPTPRNRRYLGAIRQMEEIIARLVQQRRARPAEHADLLSHLLGTHAPDGSTRLSDVEVRDEVMTFMMAGHDTTANALSWFFYVLTRHPEALDGIRTELDRVLGDREPTAADLPALAYTKRVFMEGMRIFPPVWLLTRTTTEEVALGNVRIPARAVVGVSPYAVHRHPAFWPDPETFDPERFNDERAAKRHAFAYLPFGGGPRRCIGLHFAYMEGVIAAAMVCRRFDLRLAPGAKVEPEPQVTMHPRGLQMHVHPR